MYNINHHSRVTIDGAEENSILSGRERCIKDFWND
jgi:hypothetical protein